MKKFSKGELLLHWKEGLKMTGEFSPWLRFCIDMAILMLAASPFISSIAEIIKAMN